MGVAFRLGEVTNFGNSAFRLGETPIERQNARQRGLAMQLPTALGSSLGSWSCNDQLHWEALWGMPLGWPICIGKLLGGMPLGWPICIGKPLGHIRGWPCTSHLHWDIAWGVSLGLEIPLWGPLGYAFAGAACIGELFGKCPWVGQLQLLLWSDLAR